MGCFLPIALNKTKIPAKFLLFSNDLDKIYLKVLTRHMNLPWNRFKIMNPETLSGVEILEKKR